MRCKLKEIILHYALALLESVNCNIMIFFFKENCGLNFFLSNARNSIFLSFKHLTLNMPKLLSSIVLFVVYMLIKHSPCETKLLRNKRFLIFPRQAPTRYQVYWQTLYFKEFFFYINIHYYKVYWRHWHTSGLIV